MIVDLVLGTAKCFGEINRICINKKRETNSVSLLPCSP